jgi:hypothetical protein
MSGKRHEQIFTFTMDDYLLLHMKLFHGEDDTHHIFELTGEILADALYEYLDGPNGDNINTLPPWKKKKKP